MINTEYDQFANLDHWVDFYQKNGKLPKNKILCSSCRTTTVSMLTNSNLKNTLPKYNGDIRRLLTEFKCRPCRSIGKPIKAAKVRITAEGNEEVVPRAKKGSVMVVETVAERGARIEEIRKQLPVVDFNKPKIDYSLNNPDHVRILTTTSCWQPQIFLDGGRYCDACDLYANCCCKLKRLKK